MHGIVMRSFCARRFESTRDASMNAFYSLTPSSHTNDCIPDLHVHMSM